VLVTGEWDRGLEGFATCTTDQSGQCSITAQVDADEDRVVFEIASLSHPILVQNESNNSEIDIRID
jgi:hypothetical protein